MQVSIVWMLRQPLHKASTTAEDSAGTVLAPVTAVRPALEKAPCMAAGKSHTNRRPSARSM